MLAGFRIRYYIYIINGNSVLTWTFTIFDHQSLPYTIRTVTIMKSSRQKTSDLLCYKQTTPRSISRLVLPSSVVAVAKVKQDPTPPANLLFLVPYWQPPILFHQQCPNIVQVNALNMVDSVNHNLGLDMFWLEFSKDISCWLLSSLKTPKKLPSLWWIRWSCLWLLPIIVPGRTGKPRAPLLPTTKVWCHLHYSNGLNIANSKSLPGATAVVCRLNTEGILKDYIDSSWHWGRCQKERDSRFSVPASPPLVPVFLSCMAYWAVCEHATIDTNSIRIENAGIPCPLRTWKRRVGFSVRKWKASLVLLQLQHCARVHRTTSCMIT